MRIKKERINMAIKLLCESSSIRATSRLTGLHQETVLKILKVAGHLSARVAEDKIKNFKAEVVQVDELYNFVYSRSFNTEDEDIEKGAQFTFLAVDAKSRMILNNFTGKRTRDNAVTFLTRLRQRVSERFQMNTDCWNGYAGHQNIIKRVFGKDIDHATEQKQFWKIGQFTTRTLAKITRKARIGNPDITKGSTSYVERTNLTVRHFNRRFTRCTTSYSKNLINLRHSVNLFCWHFNFARKHTTLKAVPAVFAGVSSAIMTIQDLWNYMT
jgi:IS1 family transposase